ncbi:NnrS family protein [Devosia sp. XJ19-1]|uniref:NnrS family protein n=1 Tax=Devosia ureilytica TaxID=2952754 RepID=A0A9Q4AR19_9HYPH|nr:NnrS family protein [Devosia ureilytica]MCP8884470.1 NnrS family protein [Devosia ureilytica]MCP8888078.1 NnrS family protein [Devosia ureilytica]
MTDTHPIKRKPVPRGIAHTGPVILAYGFRPFFLGAGVWAVLAMGLWIASLAAGFPIGAGYGGPAWHAHEMLFGYTSAALAGFLLTAIPNWTGRLPVSGAPLAVLFVVWLAGRMVLIRPDVIGLEWALGIDSLFLPLLFAICLREVVAGRKWRDLKVLAAVLALAIANAGYHALIVGGGDTGLASRLAISAYIMLIGIVGGRVVPSFTRNWLARRHVINLPAPYDRLDTIALFAGLAGLGLWVLWPDHPATVLGCVVAGVLHSMRLARWQSWQTADERLVLVLHLAYAAIPLGFFAIALVPSGLLDATSALHVFTLGAIGLMTLAIMSRATRGHTGMALTAPPLTAASYGFLIAAVLLRPGAALLPDHYMTLISLSGLCWMMAFTLYLVEYAPALLTRRKPRPE